MLKFCFLKKSFASITQKITNKCKIKDMRIKFDTLIQPQIDKIEKLAHFTRQQKAIFRLLCSGEYTDAGVAMQAKSAGADSVASFFAQRAKSRITSYDDTQRHVDNILHDMKEESDGTDDTFRCAYTEHLTEWVQKIKDKVSRW